MELNDEFIDIISFNHNEFRQDYCLTCGMCSSSCPVSGVDGYDPRKVIRMVSLGFNKELIESRWPWICTMCGRCEIRCPMEINITDIIRNIRSLRDRENVPGVLHKGLEQALKTGNNLGISKDDFIYILEDVSDEFKEETGLIDFKVPIDKLNTNLLLTIHNKLVNTHTEDLKPLWKILYFAKEDWTIPQDNWEGTNWGLFTGDDISLKKMVGRIIQNMEKLKVKNLLWPE